MISLNDGASVQSGGY